MFPQNSAAEVSLPAERLLFVCDTKKPRQSGESIAENHLMTALERTICRW